MKQEVRVIKPGYYKVKADADARRDEFDEKNTELIQSAQQVDIVFAGDSITHFMDENKYYPGFGLIANRGIGGDLSEVLAWRFSADVTQLWPRLCIVLVGVNDTWTLDATLNEQEEFDPAAVDEMIAQYIGNYRSMLNEARASGYPIWVCSCLPIGANRPHHIPRNKLILKMNEALQALAAEYGVPYVDYHSKVAAADGVTLQEGISDDGVHPNDAGYILMSEVLTPMLQEFFGK